MPASSSGGCASVRALAARADDASERLYALGVTDGLPVVPPTVEKVDVMLRATSRGPDEVVGIFPPHMQPCTVALVAANAVMAGCAPMHFRVVLAAVEAALAPAFALHGSHCSTMGCTPCVIVSGSAAREAGVNSGAGALGSGVRANAAIGRALKLCLQNVGGARLGGTESTTIGSANKFTMCLAEDEALLAGSGWRPLGDGASSVSLITVASGPEMLVDFATSDADELVELLALRAAGAYAAHTPLIDEALVIVSPEHFATLRRGGYATKAQLAEALWRRANAHFSRHFASCAHNLALMKAYGGAGALRCAALRLGGVVLSALFAALFALVAPLRAAPRGGSPLALFPLSRSSVLPLAALFLTVCGALALAPALAAALPPPERGSALRTAAAEATPLLLGALLTDLALACVGGPLIGAATRRMQGLLPKFTSPASFKIVVAGGAAGKFSSICPGWGVGLKGMGTSQMSTLSVAAVEAKPRFAPTAFALPVGALRHFPSLDPGSLVDPRPLGASAASAPLPTPSVLVRRPLDSAQATVALIDINKGVGGAVVLQRVAAKLRRRHPRLRVAFFKKRTFAAPCAAALLDEIVDAQRCTHAVVALAD